MIEMTGTDVVVGVIGRVTGTAAEGGGVGVRSETDVAPQEGMDGRSYLEVPA